jgi:hypothetical protein
VGGAAGDGFGGAVAVSGSMIVVGASIADRAYVFTKTGAGWQQIAQLKGRDTAGADAFGSSVAVSGSTIVVGAPGHAAAAGRAYVFADGSGGWQLAAELKGTDTIADDQFGTSVAVSGATIVVGSEVHARGAGRAYVFTTGAGGWHQVAELKGSDTVGLSGKDAMPGAIGDGFGQAVGVSGGTIVVGAFGHDNGSGRAYVFGWGAGGWQQTAELKGHGTGTNWFGYSVGVSGSTILVGAAGVRAYLFTKKTGSWQESTEWERTDWSNLNGAVSGSTVVIGSGFQSLGSAPKVGAAYVFEG